MTERKALPPCLLRGVCATAVAMASLPAAAQLRVSPFSMPIAAEVGAMERGMYVETEVDGYGTRRFSVERVINQDFSGTHMATVIASDMDSGAAAASLRLVALGGKTMAEIRDMALGAAITLSHDAADGGTSTLVEPIRDGVECLTCKSAGPHGSHTHLGGKRIPRLPEGTQGATEVDYLVAYDQKAAAVAERYGGADVFAAMVVAKNNEVLANSGIDAVFRLAGVVELNTVIPSVKTGLGAALSNPDIAAARADAKADMVLVLAEPEAESSAGVSIQEAGQQDAYSLVLATAAANTYTAIHEAGHVFGCQHSREQDYQAGDHPYAVAANRKPYFSVMGYEFGDMTSLAPVFSGPGSVWDGVTMGSATEDNVRKIRERLATVAAYGDYTAGYNVSDKYWAAPAEGEQKDITLTTNTFYFFESDAGWLRISRENGYGDTSFTISVERNNGAPRTGHVTIGGNEDYDPVVITVEQDGVSTGVGGTVAGVFGVRPVPGALLITAAGPVSAEVFDIAGRHVASKALKAGTHRIGVPCRGVYIARLSSPRGTSSFKALVP